MMFSCLYWTHTVNIHSSKFANLWFDNWLTFYDLHCNNLQQTFPVIADQTHIRKKALFLLQNNNIRGMCGVNHCLEFMSKHLNQVEVQTLTGKVYFLLLKSFCCWFTPESQGAFYFFFCWASVGGQMFLCSPEKCSDACFFWTVKSVGVFIGQDDPAPLSVVLIWFDFRLADSWPGEVIGLGFHIFFPP